ncbi:hypothetical protein BOX15_Mlig003835g1 [Macrostomum lignano]|uniref:Uncharacterized protein n=2 Tax=Macrostomum lignano TaxID=282301 RepID=A0A267FL40_9PLAT|nr:hypothetical protein BOX15_Mlig003835g1 [Macrostomum lignano]
MSELPLIPKCKEVIFDTGNILSWSRLRKKPLVSGTDEILDSTDSLVKCWLKQQAGSDALQKAEQIRVCCPIHGNQAELERSQMTPEQRAELRINLKVTIWPNAYRHGAISEAVQEALTSLSATDCDSIVLSIAGNSWSRPPNAGGLLLNDVKPLWLELEELHCADVVASLGAADFVPDLLESLHQWAKEKPRICQLHTQVACTTPLRLRNFASANGMQLLTHSDSPDPLPSDRLQQAVAKAFNRESDGQGWQPRWLVRVSSTVRDRGVVKTWGYVYKVQRNNIVPM